MVQYEIKVNGKVQGVGFRYFTKKQADILGLKGWVKNAPDGSVLVLVQGHQTDVDTFTDYLRIGPTRSRVSGLHKVEMQVVNVFSEFTIRY